MSGIILDIGTGDGSFVYALAKQYPDRLIIGLDSNHENLIEVSRKTNKKPTKGGIKNALFVLANGYDLPTEINGMVNQIFINFPWGSLLEGIIQADPVFWANVSKILKPAGFVDVIVGYDKQLETKEVLSLPDLSLDFIKNKLSHKLANLGFSLVKAEKLSSKVLKTYPSTWAKKLAFAKLRNYYYLRLKNIGK